MKSRFVTSSVAAAALLASLPALAIATTPANSSSSSAPISTAAAPARAANSQPAASVAPATHSMHHRYEALYRRAQQKLKDMGLYTGPVDGQRNTTYIASLEGFQRSHHLRASGRLTSQTQRALGLRT